MLSRDLLLRKSQYHLVLEPLSGSENNLIHKNIHSEENFREFQLSFDYLPAMLEL